MLKFRYSVYLMAFTIFQCINWISVGQHFYFISLAHYVKWFRLKVNQRLLFSQLLIVQVSWLWIRPICLLNNFAILKYWCSVLLHIHYCLSSRLLLIDCIIILHFPIYIYIHSYRIELLFKVSFFHLLRFSWIKSHLGYFLILSWNVFVIGFVFKDLRVDSLKKLPHRKWIRLYSPVVHIFYWPFFIEFIDFFKLCKASVYILQISLGI